MTAAQPAVIWAAPSVSATAAPDVINKTAAAAAPAVMATSTKTMKLSTSRSCKRQRGIMALSNARKLVKLAPRFRSNFTALAKDPALK
jgi:hypothetical protein